MTVRALVVGSMVMDLAFRVPSRPQPGQTVIAEEFAHFRGGKGYNQAVALARMGADVTLVGAVGADAYGDSFLEALVREGVDASRVVQLRGTPTAVAVPLITPNGEVGFVQYPGANRQLAAAHCADLPDCDILLLQGEINAPTSAYAARILRGRGAQVLLNPAPADEITTDLVELCTVLSPRWREVEVLIGESLEGIDGIRVAERLRTIERSAVVRLATGGAAWAAADQSGVVTAPNVSAVDSTAENDSFNAALAIAIAEERALGDAVTFATAAGAYATTVRGAEPSLPTRADVERLLSGA